jgi:hypothetical protein
MAARILSPARFEHRPDPHAPTTASAPQGQGLHCWHGASGQRYLHTVYALIECPPLADAVYVLVHHDGRGQRLALHVGCGARQAPTLNLARIRQRGATLGANEVHVHFSDPGEGQRELALCDLRAGQFGALSAEPSPSVCA